MTPHTFKTCFANKITEKQYKNANQEIMDNKCNYDQNPHYVGGRRADLYPRAINQHQSHIKLFGGLKKTFAINRFKKQLIQSVLKEYGTQMVVDAFEKYLKSRKISYVYFTSHKNLPNGQGIRRDMRRWLTKFHNDFRTKNHYNLYTIDRFCDRLSRLNTLLSADLHVTFTVNPVAIAAIGSYGLNTESCWRDGGCESRSKAHVITSKNTILMFLHNKRQPRDCDDLLARALVTRKNNKVMVWNFYSTINTNFETFKLFWPHILKLIKDDVRYYGINYIHDMLQQSRTNYINVAIANMVVLKDK